MIKIVSRLFLCRPKNGNVPWRYATAVKWCDSGQADLIAAVVRRPSFLALKSADLRMSLVFVLTAPGRSTCSKLCGQVEVGETGGGS